MEFLDTDPAIWLGESFTNLHSMEHLPALPAFIWYADRLISGSSGIIPLLVSHASLAATALLTVCNWAPRLDRKNPITWLVPTAALAAMFSLINWYNLIWAMQLHVSMSLLFLSMSVYFAAQLSPADDGSIRQGTTRILLCSAISAWAAAFSFGYGLPAILVITIHGMLARWPLRHLMTNAVFLVTLLTTYTYLLNLRKRGLSGIIDFDSGPIEMIEYIARFLASFASAIELHNVVGIQPSELALTTGLALLCLYFFGVARLYCRSIRFRQPPNSSQSASLIMTNVCVAIAIMTWISRPDETLGLAPRYYVVSILFILSLPGLYVRAKNGANKNKENYVSIFGTSIIFLVISLMGHFANHPYPGDPVEPGDVRPWPRAAASAARHRPCARLLCSPA